MPLTLQLTLDTKLPIDVRRLSAALNDGLDRAQVEQLEVFVGNRSRILSDCFSLTGRCDTDLNLHFKGQFENVNSIGRDLTRGSIVIDSNAGRHVGSGMSGGEITVNGNASHFVGTSMRGGSIRVLGDAGDFAGGHLPGASSGTNRGQIVITGNAGKGLGRRMRRGLIVVCGNAAELVAWDMQAGTIVVFGSAGAQAATGIVRGTVIFAGQSQGQNQGQSQPLNPHLSPSFSAGPTFKPPIMNFIGNWLKRSYPDLLTEPVEKKLLNQPFTQHHANQLSGRRGEIFVAP